MLLESKVEAGVNIISFFRVPCLSPFCLLVICQGLGGIAAGARVHSIIRFRRAQACAARMDG